MTTFKNYIRSTSDKKGKGGLILSKSNWSGPNDLGFYFRDVNIYSCKCKHTVLFSITESLYFTIFNNNKIINIVQVVKDRTDKLCFEGLIEYHENNKYIKLKSLNVNYFTFIDFFIFI